MHTRSLALLLLISSALPALAQDSGGSAGTPDSTTSSPSSPSVSGSTSSSTDPQKGTDANTPDALAPLPALGPDFDKYFNKGSSLTPSPAVPPPAKVESDSPTFALPGGYGNAPVSLGGGRDGEYTRPPILFTTTANIGYDDNVNSNSGVGVPATTQIVKSTSGALTSYRYVEVPGIPATPIAGSLFAQGALGSKIYLAASRAVLTLDVNLGAVYYENRPGIDNPISPTGGLGLIFAYKLTPRAQVSAAINGQYADQPSLTTVNGPTQSGGGQYLTTNSKFDLTYQWTGRISTVTTFNLDNLTYQSSAQEGNDFTTTTVGQALRYGLSPRLLVVAEGRSAQTTYKVAGSDSDTQFLLVGGDLTLTRRFTGSLRLGEEYRQYKVANSNPTSSPFLESSLSYGYGKASTLSLTSRYGFEEGASTSRARSTQKTFRSGVSVTQAFTAQLSANASISYSHSSFSSFTGESVSTSEDLISASLGAQFLLNRSFTIFGNLTHSDVETGQAVTSYSKEIVTMGATFTF